MRAFHFGLFLVLFSTFVARAAVEELKDDAERISYSVGYQIGGDFKSQGVEIKPELLVRGIRDAIENGPPLLTRKEMDNVLVGLKKKIMADERARGDREAAGLRSAGAAFLTENAKKKGVTVLPSGVQYEVLIPGAGRKPLVSDEVAVHYRVTRVDGREMGSTYPGGKPRSFQVEKALPGLKEVLPLMEEGAKWRVVIPTGIAAGGREPKGETVPAIYEVELLQINTEVKEVTEGTGKRSPATEVHKSRIDSGKGGGMDSPIPGQKGEKQ